MDQWVSASLAPAFARVDEIGNVPHSLQHYRDEWVGTGCSMARETKTVRVANAHSSEATKAR